MLDPDALPAWKPALDALTGARHGGQVQGLLERLRALDRAHPGVGEIAYQVAWELDALGREAEALPHYERALSLGLPPNEHGDALLGLSRALRATGRPDRAADVLESARTQFPEQPEFNAFLALARYDQGRHADAFRLLIDVMLDTTEDPGLNAHQRSLRHAAAQLG